MMYRLSVPLHLTPPVLTFLCRSVVPSAGLCAPHSKGLDTARLLTDAAAHSSPIFLQLCEIAATAPRALLIFVKHAPPHIKVAPQL